jgi:hypothetical protein
VAGVIGTGIRVYAASPNPAQAIEPLFGYALYSGGHEKSRIKLQNYKANFKTYSYFQNQCPESLWLRQPDAWAPLLSPHPSHPL